MFKSNVDPQTFNEKVRENQTIIFSLREEAVKHATQNDFKQCLVVGNKIKQLELENEQLRKKFLIVTILPNILKMTIAELDATLVDLSLFDYKICKTMTKLLSTHYGEEKLKNSATGQHLSIKCADGVEDILDIFADSSLHQRLDKKSLQESFDKVSKPSPLSFFKRMSETCEELAFLKGILPFVNNLAVIKPDSLIRYYIISAMLGDYDAMGNWGSLQLNRGNGIPQDIQSGIQKIDVAFEFGYLGHFLANSSYNAFKASHRDLLVKHAERRVDDANCILGLLSFLNEEIDEAIQFFNKEHKIDPNEVFVLVGLCVCKIWQAREGTTKKKGEDIARDQLMESAFNDAKVLQKKGHPLANHLLGSIQIIWGEYSEAKKYWQESQQNNPSPLISKNLELLESLIQGKVPKDGRYRWELPGELELRAHLNVNAINVFAKTQKNFIEGIHCNYNKFDGLIATAESEGKYATAAQVLYALHKASGPILLTSSQSLASLSSDEIQPSAKKVKKMRRTAALRRRRQASGPSIEPQDAALHKAPNSAQPLSLPTVSAEEKEKKIITEWEEGQEIKTMFFALVTLVETKIKRLKDLPTFHDVNPWSELDAKFAPLLKKRNDIQTRELTESRAAGFSKEFKKLLKLAKSSINDLGKLSVLADNFFVENLKREKQEEQRHYEAKTSLLSAAKLKKQSLLSSEVSMPAKMFWRLEEEKNKEAVPSSETAVAPNEVKVPFSVCRRPNHWHCSIT